MSHSTIAANMSHILKKWMVQKQSMKKKKSEGSVYVCMAKLPLWKFSHPFEDIENKLASTSHLVLIKCQEQQMRNVYNL